MYRSPNRERIGLALRRYGMSKLARQIGVSRQAVYYWAEGEDVPAKRCGVIAKILGCKLYDLRPDIFEVNT